MKGCSTSSNSQFYACKEMMSGKFVTPDWKSMLLEGDIIALSWRKNKCRENQSWHGETAQKEVGRMMTMSGN